VTLLHGRTRFIRLSEYTSKSFPGGAREKVSTNSSGATTVYASFARQPGGMFSICSVTNSSRPGSDDARRYWLTKPSAWN
jgi:hypothetical protein